MDDRPLPEERASSDDVTFFETRVRPVLSERCYECHDPSRGAVKGGLDLSTAAGWRRGGLSGPALVPGDVDENLAFGHAWRHRDYVIRAFNDDKPYDEFVFVE